MLPIWSFVLPLLFIGNPSEKFDPAFPRPEPTKLEAYESLLGHDSILREKVILNEACLNLVNVSLADKTLARKKERHQVFGGGIAKLLGFRWLRISTEKQKFVGTLRDDLRVPGDPFLSEADLNWNLVPHLKTYIDMVSYGYQVQKDIGRAKKKKDYSVPPFVYPEQGEDLYPYKLHCEHTPSPQYRFMLDALFFPCIRPGGLKDHINFGEEHPSVGMYGPFVSDCNHKCHPELHPYEWIWWLNLHPDRANPERSKEWYIGLLQEGSNRFPKWTASPRVGKISIPFFMDQGIDSMSITISPLVFDCMHQQSLDDWEDIPQGAEAMDFNRQIFELPGAKTLSLINDSPQSLGGWMFWIELDPDLSTENQVVGNLYFGIAVHELFTARVVQSW